MPIPYMGSKRVIGQYIYRAIANREPKGVLADPFCGGFAISEIFIKNGWKVVASDKNKYVIALIRAVVNNEPDYMAESEHPHFYTREEFMDIAVNNPDKYPDWKVGYLQCIWSFGNQQTNYLFGKDVEPIKRAGHLWAIENNDIEIRKIFGNKIPEQYYAGVKKLPDWHKRRIAIVKISKKLQTRVLELQQLERLQRLEQLQQLEQLQRLERLQQLEQLQRLERLECCSYDELEIPEKAVIYCDPPYANTGEYAEAGFDSAKFWAWAEEKSKTHPVYVSEYTAPDGWVPVLTVPRRSSMQGGNSSKFYDEKLFVLRRQDGTKTK